MQPDNDRLPKRAKQLIAKLSEEVAEMKGHKSLTDRTRQSSLPHLQQKKVQAHSQPLKKLVQKSKEDFFARRNSSHSRLRHSSHRKEEPLIRQFQSEVDRIMKSDQKKEISSRISSKLHELLSEEQPYLNSNLREIEQYNLQRSRTLRKNSVVETNIDLNKLSLSRFVLDRQSLPALSQVKAFKIPLRLPGIAPNPTFAVYHTKEGDVQMACETVEENDDKVRIRFVNGFEKWVKKPDIPITVVEEVSEQLNVSVLIQEDIAIPEKLLKDTLSQVKINNRPQYNEYLQEELRRNYTMSMTYFKTMLSGNRLPPQFIGSKIIQTGLRGGIKHRKQQMEKILLGSEGLNFIKEFTLDKTKYFSKIVDAYATLRKIEDFKHFEGFLNSFTTVIAPSTMSMSDKIRAYFFHKKQQFEMLIYQIESTVNNLNDQVKNDINTKVKTNSRLESIPYVDSLKAFTDSLTTRLNMLIRSHTLQGVINGLKELAEFYSQQWPNSIIASPNLPKLPVYDSFCELPHPLKYKPLIELKLEHKRIKKIKKKNIYKYLLDLRHNLKHGRSAEQSRVYCRPVEQLQTEFLQKLTNYLHEISFLENINGCTKATVIGFVDTDEMTRYKAELKQKVGRSYRKVTVVCSIMSNFDMYLADKSYVDEVLQLFERINGCELVRDQLNYLSQDLKLVLAIPDLIYCDLLVIHAKQLKQKIIATIDSNRNRIIKACELRLISMYDRSHQRLVAVESRIETAYNNIDLFLNFYQFFKDRHIEQSTNLVAAQMLIINKLYNTLVEISARIPIQVTKQYLACQDWLRRLQNSRLQAKKKLAAASQMFVSAIKQTKLKIFTRLQKMLRELVEVGKLTDTTNYRKNSAMCKSIFEQLREMSENAEGITQKQTIFNLTQSDLSLFTREKIHFEKYMRLWDYIEKLKEKQTMKKLTVANFNPQDLLNLSRQGLEVVYFIKRNTVNKRCIALVESVRHSVTKLIEKLPLLMVLLDPCFSETQWLSLFKQVFPQQERFLSFYEMSITDIQNTGILSHPKEIYEHYRLAHNDYGVVAYLNFFERALKQMQFSYCIMDELQMLIVPAQTLASLTNLRDYYAYMSTIFYKQGKIEGIYIFLKSINKALQQMQAILPLLRQLNCIFRWYLSRYCKQQFVRNSDILASVAFDYAKKTETIKRLTLFNLYEDRSKLSFTDSLKTLEKIKFIVLKNLSPLKQRYPFLQWLDNSHIYDMLASTDSSEQIDSCLRNYLLPQVNRIGLSVNDKSICLKTIETAFDEEIQFELEFYKVKTPDDGTVGMGLFDIFEYLRRQLPKVIKCQCLLTITRIHNWQFDIALIYEYYATSHTPLQSVLLAMLIQFHMTFLCICESKSDIKQFKDWLLDRVNSKTIPSQPIRKQALDLMLEMTMYFIRVLNHFESHCEPRSTNYEFLALPKMLLCKNEVIKSYQQSKQLIAQLNEWTSTVKANLQQDTFLFSKIVEGPVYKLIGLEILDRYVHDSQLGSDQQKILKLANVKDFGDIGFGLETFGWMMDYCCHLTPLTIPKMQQHLSLSETIIAYNTNKIVLLSVSINQFMFGRMVFRFEANIFKESSRQCLVKLSQQADVVLKVVLSKSDSQVIIKASKLSESRKAALCIEYSTLQIKDFVDMPDQIMSCYQLVNAEPLLSPITYRLYLDSHIKGIPINQLAKLLVYTNHQAEYNRIQFAEAILQHYRQTGVAWHSDLHVECLYQQIFAVESVQTIRAMANIGTITRPNKPFYVIYLPLYEYSMVELLGGYVQWQQSPDIDKKMKDQANVQTFSETVWQRGIIERLFDDLQKQRVSTKQQNFYINNYFWELSNGKLASEKQKLSAQTNEDWYVFDLSLWMPQNKDYLYLIDWIIRSVQTGTFVFGSGRSVQARLRKNKIVLKLPGIHHLPINVVSLPFLLNPKNSSVINIDRELALWRHRIESKNQEFEQYTYGIVQLAQLIFQHTKPTFASVYDSSLNFMKLFRTFTQLLTVCVNQARKFYIAHGFYNYTDLSQEQKRSFVSPVDLRNVSSIKDDLEQLQEISVQEKQLENSRRVLFKDLNTFMTANKISSQQKIKSLSKRQIRHIYCVQSITVFSFFWSFCSLSKDSNTNTEIKLVQGIISALQKYSASKNMQHYSFNLKELSSLHGDSFNLGKFVYNLQRESWLSWREVLMPNVEAISTSFTDRILQPHEIARLNPHANSIDYISDNIEYLNENNNHFVVPVNTHSSPAVEYLTKFFMAYEMPVCITAADRSRLTQFSASIKQQLLSFNPNKVLSLAINAKTKHDLAEYLASRVRYGLLSRFNKLKGKHQLNDRSHRTFIFVQDINIDRQQFPSPLAILKSVGVYRKAGSSRVLDCSLVLLGHTHSQEIGIEHMAYVKHQDCEPSVLLTIFNTIAQSFRPNGLQVFNYLCANPQVRYLTESLKLYAVKSDYMSILKHLNRSVTSKQEIMVIKEDELKKQMELKVKQQTDYFKFLKGEGVKNFGREQKPFEQQRMDREKQVIELETGINTLYANLQPSILQNVQKVKLIAPKYLIEQPPVHEYVRKQSLSPQRKRQLKHPYNELIMVENIGDLSTFLVDIVAKYLETHYTSIREKYRIVNRDTKDIIKDVLFELNALEVHGQQQQHFLLISNDMPEYSQFVFRVATMIKQKAFEQLSQTKKHNRLVLSQQDIKQTNILQIKMDNIPRQNWTNTVEDLIDQCYTILNKDLFNKHMIVVFELGQQCNEFIKYFMVDMLSDTRCLDKMVPNSLIDKSILATKYKGYEGVYRAHLISMLKEKVYFCYIVDKDWLNKTLEVPYRLVRFEFPLKVDPIKLPNDVTISNLKEHLVLDIDSIVFIRAYDVYRKYFRKQFITSDNYQYLMSVDQAERLFTNFTKELLELFSLKQQELIHTDSFTYKLQREFNKKLSILGETIARLKLELSVKKDSQLQIEQQCINNTNFINSSESNINQLKQTIETSEFIKSNSQKQKLGYNGREHYLKSKELFKHINKKQMEKEVSQQDFYQNPLIIFYVYMSNILTDNNFFNERYSEVLESSNIEELNQEQKKQFIRSIGYGRLFLVVDTAVIENLSVQQINMARKIRRLFPQLKAIDGQAKKRNLGRIYSQQNPYSLSDELAEQLSLIKRQKFTELQYNFVQFMAHCYNFKRDSLKMDIRIVQNRKNIEASTEKIKLNREAVKNARQELEIMQDELRLLKNKINDLENELAIAISNQRLLEQVFKQDISVLKPAFLYENTYVYTDKLTRRYQALLLAALITMTISSWDEFMTDELFEQLRKDTSQDQLLALNRAVDWLSDKMYLKLIDWNQLSVILQYKGICNQKSFWNMVFAQLLIQCHFNSAKYELYIGIKIPIETNNFYVRLSQQSPTICELLLLSFQNRVSTIMQKVMERLQELQIENSKKYAYIVERIQSASLKADLIEGLRYTSFDTTKPAIDDLLTFDLRSHLKRYEQVQKELTHYKDCRQISQLIEYTVQICKDNSINQSTASFVKDFLRIFNQVYYEFSSMEDYFVMSANQWLKNLQKSQPPIHHNIFTTLKKPEEHKRLVSDYDRLNETARKQEIEMEQIKGSMSSLQIPLLNSRLSLYKKPFSKRLDCVLKVINEPRESIDIHEFVKKSENIILRLNASQSETVCDYSQTSEVRNESWFDWLVKCAIEGKQPVDKTAGLPSQADIRTVESYFPSELLRVFMHNQIQLVNERAGLATIMRLHMPIAYIISDGQNNIVQLIQLRLAQDGITLIVMDFVCDTMLFTTELAKLKDDQILLIRCTNATRLQDVAILAKSLSSALLNQRLSLVFVIYCRAHQYATKKFERMLNAPVYYMKGRNNMKSELIRLYPKLYSDIMTEIEVVQQNTTLQEYTFQQEKKGIELNSIANPSLYWIESDFRHGFLKLKLQLLFILVRIRAKILGSPSQRATLWLFESKLPIIRTLMMRCKVGVVELIYNIIEAPDLSPILNELVELVNFTVDNVIYEFSDPKSPLLKILPSFNDFLTIITRMPDSDHKDILLLTQLQRIHSRSRRNFSIMQEQRFSEMMKIFKSRLNIQKKNPPMEGNHQDILQQINIHHSAIGDVRQSFKELCTFFENIFQNSYEVELFEDRPHNFKLKGNKQLSRLNITQLTRKEIKVQALSRPESYQVLFKMMKFLKKIRGARSRSSNYMSNHNPHTKTMRIVIPITMKEAIELVLRSQTQTIIRQHIYLNDEPILTGRQLKRLNRFAANGYYLKQLYINYLQNQIPPVLDISQIFCPVFVLYAILLARATPFNVMYDLIKKPPLDFRLIASTTKLENKEELSISGFSIKYARVDASDQLVSSDNQWNPIGPIFIGVAERDNPDHRLVVCMHQTINLEEQCRSSLLKERRGGLKLQPYQSDKYIVQIPLFFDFVHYGHVYIETSLEHKYIQDSDVHMTCR